MFKRLECNIRWWAAYLAAVSGGTVPTEHALDWSNPKDVADTVDRFARCVADLAATKGRR